MNQASAESSNRSVTNRKTVSAKATSAEWESGLINEQVEKKYQSLGNGSEGWGDRGETGKPDPEMQRSDVLRRDSN